MEELFHGSNTSGIECLKPRQADHDRPYVYFATNKVVAAFYLCNAVKRPYYWFPYGFAEDGVTPVYHELYPDALREVSEGVKGAIYRVEAAPGQTIPFKNIPCARLGIVPVRVSGVTEVPDAYRLFLEYIKQGSMVLARYEEKTKQELEMWDGMILDYIREKEMIKIPDCSYAEFVRKKFPWVWEEYAGQS